MTDLSPQQVPATLCGKTLRGVMHACAFVDSRDEQYEILLPYLQEGLACKERLITMVGKVNLHDHCERLRRGGLDPDVLEARGELSVSTSEESFPRDGSTTPSSILAGWEANLDEAERSGYSGVRGFREMDSALAASRRTDDLLEHEARVNFLALRMAHPVVCVYDVNNVSGRLIMEILSTHPKVIVGGRLHENPYFVSPEAYLTTLALRRRRPLRFQERRASML
jgi:hypothetical protein